MRVFTFGRAAGRAAAALAGTTAVGSVCFAAREERVAQCLSLLGSSAKAPVARSSASKLKGLDDMARYELHEVLGRGKFGVVHRATLASTGEQVAIKLLPKDGKVSHLHEADMMRAIFWWAHARLARRTRSPPPPPPLSLPAPPPPRAAGTRTSSTCARPSTRPSTTCS